MFTQMDLKEEDIKKVNSSRVVPPEETLRAGSPVRFQSSYQLYLPKGASINYARLFWHFLLKKKKPNPVFSQFYTGLDPLTQIVSPKNCRSLSQNGSNDLEASI